MQGNQTSFPDVDKDWRASSAECERSQFLLQDMVRAGKAHFLQALRERAKGADSLMPPRTTVEEPETLRSAGIQGAFISTMNKHSIGALCGELSMWNRAMRQGTGLGCGKENDLNNARFHGNRGCGVHGVLTAIAKGGIAQRCMQVVRSCHRH